MHIGKRLQLGKKCRARPAPREESQVGQVIVRPGDLTIQKIARKIGAGARLSRADPRSGAEVLAWPGDVTHIGYLVAGLWIWSRFLSLTNTSDGIFFIVF